MFMHNITKSAFLSLALIAGSTAALSAQERLFEWTGRVDSEVRLFVRGTDVWTQDLYGRQLGRSRARVTRGLPGQAGQVRVELLDGRGDVRVIQQPSSRNNYTAVVRIRDDDRRADRYRIVAYWRPIGRGRWGTGAGDIDDRYPGRGRDDDRYDDDWYGDRSGMLRWSGAVDDEVEIRIQGRNVETRTLSGNGTRDVRADLNGRALPRRDVTVSVRERSGRGTVTVVQQPSQWNGYTAVIRVRDRQGGFEFYDFEVSW